MCVAAVAWNAHPRWRLVVAGNRDEFHARPAAPLARWGDGIIAGKDLTGGGTWLGVHEAGRFALVTNFRQPEGPQPNRPSRGQMVVDLLQGRTPEQLAQMNTFNVIHSDGDQAGFLTNYPEVRFVPLAPGIHGLSNGGFHDRWPKTLQLEAALADWLQADIGDCEPLLDALRAETPDPALARASEGPEPRFAPVFIRDETYGTRCSTVIAVDVAGAGTIVERRFDAQGQASGETRLEFRWPG
ncbi:uncharacterized protein with NRDE domain [Novosphingobium chloroacetimidivorans]|uniref:Uncharacterized protein with NRDE domain n=1 Tax=Novosphingobium chloroacetimidivorans TaxID=1428314 RepID=A0A7W7K5Y1_9SPHN|nr:NRDE family protein [Novosphingobium chloroacetimidivorans]MBB4856877.1 uncharacterized protein with NRDE domain [Novosphingobium chloroacetimidivorans]